VTLPSDVQKVLNARADDAIRAIYTAVEDGDRSALDFAARELVDVLEDEEAAKQEFSA
jgi:TRAP-type C4-dicarboxylate transport system substrate-binding protein